jgi:probable rRNA maturation factor
VVFCDDDFIQDLNREYRQKDHPTDVLSFPQDPQSGILGDVVISVPTAQRQAEGRGHLLEEEIEWLFLHGSLHLLGYDDETEEQAALMDRRASLARQTVAGASVGSPDRQR